jgi:N-acetylglucosamine-6-phosphate deacetylase
LNVESLEFLYTHCLQGGCASFLPTVATSSFEVYFSCIDAVKQYWKLGKKGCLGLHLEGPFIAPQKSGAHTVSQIKKANVNDLLKLLKYGKGIIKMITLAPEVCDSQFLNVIKNEGIIISAGHSNASFDQANIGFANGVSTVTHLYNAMSSLQHREPGLVGATFAHTSVFASIIADGFHVDFEAIKIAKKQMGKRLFAITDAVTNNNVGNYLHKFENGKYQSNGILSGSALTIFLAMQNLIKNCNISCEEAIKMCSIYPAKVLGINNKIGSIKINYEANFIALNANFDYEKTLVM